jgi:hypothetical protein
MNGPGARVQGGGIKVRGNKGADNRRAIQYSLDANDSMTAEEIEFAEMESLLNEIYDVDYSDSWYDLEEAYMMDLIREERDQDAKDWWYWFNKLGEVGDE